MYPSRLNELVYSEDMVLLPDFKDLQNDNSKDMKAKFHFFTKSGHHQKCPHPTTYLELDRTKFVTYYYLINNPSR